MKCEALVEDETIPAAPGHKHPPRTCGRGCAAKFRVYGRKMVWHWLCEEHLAFFRERRFVEDCK